VGGYESESAPSPSIPSDRAPTHSPSHSPTQHHAIRLRGPWDYQVIARAVERGGKVELGEADLPPPGRVTMPTDWGESLGAEFRGQVLYRRKFNGPSGIAAALRVLLVFDAADAAATITLNNTTLGHVTGKERAEFDVTGLVRQHNTITAIVEKLPSRDRADSPGGLVGEVRLEIRGPDAGWLDKEKLAARAVEDESE
jgi:beta-galactosidase/beta-glucuronidase